MEFKHIPVLLNEVIEGLEINPDGIYVDCTIGGGGHSLEIAKRLSPRGRLIGFDRDSEAIEVCKNRFVSFDNVTLINDNFKNAPSILEKMGISDIDGVLVDLGVSSYQLDNAERGFSIVNDGRLDMRMDKSQALDAYSVVNTYPKEKLLQILYDYGEEANAKKIVNKIIENRPIERTSTLKEIIESCFPKKIIYGKGGVSKQTFQAIRIEVNGELSGLDKFIEQFIPLIKPGGKMAVISFHSLEDRIVKNTFKKLATNCICPPKTPVCICGHKASVRLVNNKPIIASKSELEYNSRSSSAKLRIIEKIRI